MEKPNLEKSKGLVIDEAVTSTAIFLVFAFLLGALVVAGSMYLQKLEAELIVQQCCRDMLDLVATELKQAVPCPDTGRGETPPRGFLSVKPYVGYTGVLYPNKNNPQGDYLEFTQPDFQKFDPSNHSFNPLNPGGYKLVRYYTGSGSTLIREVVSYKDNGKVLNDRARELSDPRSGDVNMSIKWKNNRFYEVKIIINKDGLVYSNSADVFIPAGIYNDGIEGEEDKLSFPGAAFKQDASPSPTMKTGDAL